jgi:hypothetical protein
MHIARGDLAQTQASQLGEHAEPEVA